MQGHRHEKEGEFERDQRLRIEKFYPFERLSDRISWNKAVRAQCTDIGQFMHHCNIAHMRRRILDRSSKTERLKDANDPSQHPSIILRRASSPRRPRSPSSSAPASCAAPSRPSSAFNSSTAPPSRPASAIPLSPPPLAHATHPYWSSSQQLARGGSGSGSGGFSPGRITPQLASAVPSPPPSTMPQPQRAHYTPPATSKAGGAEQLAALQATLTSIILTRRIFAATALERLFQEAKAANADLDSDAVDQVITAMRRDLQLPDPLQSSE